MTQFSKVAPDPANRMRPRRRDFVRKYGHMGILSLHEHFVHRMRIVHLRDTKQYATVTSHQFGTENGAQSIYTFRLQQCVPGSLKDPRELSNLSCLHRGKEQSRNSWRLHFKSRSSRERRPRQHKFQEPQRRHWLLVMLDACKLCDGQAHGCHL